MSGGSVRSHTHTNEPSDAAMMECRFDGRWYPGGDSRDRDTGDAARLHTLAANSH